VAVAPMRRVEVVGYAPVLEDVLDALQRAGAVQVEPAPEGLATAELAQDGDRLRQLEELHADAKFVHDQLAKHHTPSQPFAAFVTEKFHVPADTFAAIDAEAELLPLYELTSTLVDRIASAKRERARLAALVSDLEPWEGVHLQISRWKGTDHVALIAGTIPGSDSVALRARLREAVPLASVAEYGHHGAIQAWLVLVHSSSVSEARAALNGSKFKEVSFPGLEDYPAEEASHARGHVAELTAQIAEAETELVQVSRDHYPQAVALLEAVDSEREAAHALGSFGRTERAFVLTGWIRASKADEVVAALGPWAADLDISLREPTEDEDPPVELDNARWLKPFEVLTDLYGRPSYRELDPTPFLAPFFLLFFAICIGDVGYGAMLIAGAWLIKNKLDVTTGVKRFMDLMMVGGAGAMVVGVLFASYFALDVAYLPPFLRALQVLDPLAQLQTFLIITIGLGVAQVFFGVGIAAYDTWRKGDPASAIFEQMSTIFLFVMIGVCVFGYSSGNALLGNAALWIGLLGTMLMQGRTLEAALGDTDRPLWDRAFGWVWLAAMLAWVASVAFGGPGFVLWILLGLTLVGLFVAKTVRKCVTSFLGGAYAVYGMSAFLGDTLSYTRLAALGLSGALVGMVFNVLAKMVWDPVVGMFTAGGMGYVWGVVAAVAAIAIFVVGHVFNVVINLLGAFVHPARLQFVEFFSKFYEGGGRPLKPFKFATRSVVLGAGESGIKEGA
jgi:V/A-type H+/Na+-transporting ATPase subunit I